MIKTGFLIKSLGGFVITTKVVLLEYATVIVAWGPPRIVLLDAHKKRHKFYDVTCLPISRKFSTISEDCPKIIRNFRNIFGRCERFLKMTRSIKFILSGGNSCKKVFEMINSYKSVVCLCFREPAITMATIHIRC